MQELLHKNGINMRYLGKVLESLAVPAKDSTEEI